MDIETKAKKLMELYQDFEEKSQVYRQTAVCVVGCADCCINVGNVDAVTLEGWLILEHIKSLEPWHRFQLKQRIEENARDKRESIYTRCAFLQDNLSCAIYPVRPFSCRRLYSLVRCGKNGPTVHRQVWKMTQKTVAAIQSLDGGGGVGHLSHVLLFLQETQFGKTDLLSDQADHYTDHS